MKTQAISNFSHSSSLRSLLATTRKEINKAKQEVTTGLVFDVGLSLGHKTGQTVSLRSEFNRLNIASEQNKLTQQRMKTAQIAMGAMVKDAQGLLKSVTGVTGARENATVIAKSANSTLHAITDLLNTSFNGEAVFGGINTKTTPVVEYTEGSAPKKAIQQAFKNHFGFSIDDPKVKEITAEEMKTFLEGDFAKEFNNKNWMANWSKASDAVINSQISANETINTSVSANADGFRKAVMSAVMVAEFAPIGLNDAALSALTGQATKSATDAIEGITSEQAALGLSEARTEAVTVRISAQQNILNRSVLDLEAVDPAEAKTRLDSLVDQLNLAYQLTAELRKLSLLNYLR